MKKLITACIVFIALAYLSNAQCTISIPPWATVVNTTITVAAVADTFWVCSGDTVNGSGVDNVYYVESGGALDMSGFHKTVYLKAGASINCSGIDDTVYYEPGAIISCSGNHFDSLCTQLVFDYSHAPANGCVITNLSPNPSPPESGILQCYPNPAQEEITITYFSTDEKEWKLYVLNSLGKEIFSMCSTTSNLKLQTSNFPKGIYFLKAGVVVNKFVIE